MGARFRLSRANLHDALCLRSRERPGCNPTRLNALYHAPSETYSPIPYSGDYSERLPLFHQLDIRADKTWQFKTWQLSFYLDLQLPGGSRRGVDASLRSGDCHAVGRRPRYARRSERDAAVGAGRDRSPPGPRARRPPTAARLRATSVRPRAPPARCAPRGARPWPRRGATSRAAAACLRSTVPRSSGTTAPRGCTAPRGRAERRRTRA